MQHDSSFPVGAEFLLSVRSGGVDFSVSGFRLETLNPKPALSAGQNFGPGAPTEAKTDLPAGVNTKRFRAKGFKVFCLKQAFSVSQIQKATLTGRMAKLVV